MADDYEEDFDSLLRQEEELANVRFGSPAPRPRPRTHGDVDDED